MRNMAKEANSHRSMSLDRPFLDFIEKYLKNHKVERQQEGKSLTMISVIREALFLWAKEKGVTDELMKFLEQKK